MEKKITYVLGGLFILLAIFCAQYEFSRYQKIKHDVNCIAPCVQEIIPPSSWSVITGKYRGGIFGSEVRLPNFRKECDQSATTTDCSKIPSIETPIIHENNPIIPGTSPSGKIDEHLTINNELRDVNFCGKTYKVKQVMIDGVDVVQRVAEIANKFNGGGEQDILRAKSICGNIEFGTSSSQIDIPDLIVDSTSYSMRMGRFLAFTIKYPSLEIETSKAEEEGSVVIGKLK